MSHRAEWTLDDLGVTATFTCTEPEGSDCRMICDRGCDDGRGRCPADRDAHELSPIDYCNVVEWLNDGPVWETYSGKPTTIRDGGIIPNWDGSGYQWDYAAEETLDEAQKKLAQVEKYARVLADTGPRVYAGSEIARALRNAIGATP